MIWTQQINQKKKKMLKQNKNHEINKKGKYQKQIKLDKIETYSFFYFFIRNKQREVEQGINSKWKIRLQIKGLLNIKDLIKEIRHLWSKRDSEVKEKKNQRAITNWYIRTFIFILFFINFHF